MNLNEPVVIDENLLRATVKLNTFLFAGVSALMGALAMLIITYVSTNRGAPNPGHFLNLLGVFLPGYTVSGPGAWAGFFWGWLIGGIAGALIYRIYSRGIRTQVAEYFAGVRSGDSLEYAVVKLHGHSLGLALGGIAAVGLLITTNWLVIRGSAVESVHASLMSHYLPGYAVSFPGSLIGAIEILIVTYVTCRLLGGIYNRVVSLRSKDRA